MAERTSAGLDRIVSEPERSQVSAVALNFGLLGAAGAWSIQLLVIYGLTGYACFPSQTPLHDPAFGWNWARSASLALNVVSALVAIAAVALSYRNWREMPARRRGEGEPVDRRHGRIRFMAGWGLWGGLWFLVAILFNTLAIVWMPGCGG